MGRGGTRYRRTQIVCVEAGAYIALGIALQQFLKALFIDTGSTIQNVSIDQWFAGRLLKGEDRAQSVGKYFPYGEDRTSPNPVNPANDTEKFATYTRDSATGLDYAINRYYSSVIGRFMTTDPYAGSAINSVPQSWNRYSYVESDPIGGSDPDGLVELNFPLPNYLDIGLSTGFRYLLVCASHVL
jgi:RHS repeat-associated protein